MAMNLCDDCAIILIRNNKIPPTNSSNKWLQSACSDSSKYPKSKCEHCGKNGKIFNYAEAKKEHFSKESYSQCGALDEKLMKRAMGLHITIKEKNKIIIKLEEEKVQLLEENRKLRIRLDIVNGNPYSNKKREL